ncbi:hypothetical protein CRYUN_Cryun31cG0130500 [Craigia yunnanensis]
MLRFPCHISNNPRLRLVHKLSLFSSYTAFMVSKPFLKTSSSFTLLPLIPSPKSLSTPSKRLVPSLSSKPIPKNHSLSLRTNGFSSLPYANVSAPVYSEDLEDRPLDMRSLEILKHKLKQLGIDISACVPGHQNRLMCPLCNGGDSEEISLSLFISQDGSSASWMCFRAKCGWKGHTKAFADGKSSFERFNRVNVVKVKRQITVESLQLEPLCNQLIAYFAERMISAETLKRNAVMQKKSGDEIAIAFTYWCKGNLVNCKYRDIVKRFWQEKDTEKIFYGLDDIEDASDIIIVEGEMDKLAMEEAGFRNCVSVPDGAPPSVSQKEVPAEEQVLVGLKFNTACYLVFE